MRRLSRPVHFLGLTLSPVALLLLLSSCAYVLAYLGCPYYFFPGWIFSRGGRLFPLQFAIAEGNSAAGASYYNERGGPAFPWALSGRRPSACFAVVATVFAFDAILTFQEPGGERADSPRSADQNRPGLPIYFVGAPASSVTVLNSETAATMGVIPVGNDPRWIEGTPDHSQVFVTNFASDSVSVINTATMAVEQTIELPAGSGPIGVAPGPDDGRVYVVNSTLNSLSAIDLASGEVIATADAGDGATHVAVSPDGQLAYVTNSGDGTVSVFDTLSMGPVTTIDAIPGAMSVVFEPRGRKAYVTGGGTSGTGLVHVINTSDHTLDGAIRVGTNPVSVRLSPYGNFLLVANRGSGAISVIDLRNENVRESVRVGQAPVDVAAVL